MRLILAACLCLVLGCAGESFKDEADELEYLSSLSQPSVAQHHRRKELEGKAALAKFEAKEKADQVAATEQLAADKIRHADEKSRAARKAIEDAAKAKAALVEAREWEGRFTAGEPKATSHYRKLVVDYPDSPEADVARERIKELAGSQ